MKMGWPTKSLAEACQIKPPKSEARGKLSDSDLVSFLPMEAMGIDQMLVVPNQAKPLSEVAGSYTYFSEGDVLLAKITPCFENGKLGIASGLMNGVGFGSSEYMVFRPDNSVSKEWLYYFLSREAFRIEGTARMSGAVGHKRVAKEFIETYPIPVPPLAEQQRIVGVLDEAFAGLATAHANAAKNLQNARALFESHLQSVFTQPGEGWLEMTIGDVCQFVGGSQPPKSVFSKTKSVDNIRLIQIRDYKSDKHVVYIPRAQARRFCSADDVMIGRYGPPLFQILRGLDGAYNVALMKAVPDESKISRDFLFYFLKHSTILEYVIYHSSRAAGQIGVTKETLEPYPISLPSLSEQKKVVANIDALVTETQRLAGIYEQKQAALAALKQSLMHQAFNGEL
ncbi:restriction endonuclease subunit S [Synechococcus sp. J7-Johnson]|uniref:restriction endonuclease subunit S n=1 Tax=Synechococcus sp. J7-Johnson TaxID=2823737 RepID=UPI0020CD2C75|nr:restriction endonuclease subunit S [Synechococcus sp. J7-Johnson]MCP9841971.1 restriction endonuclease subunit S [Synechococcus sp. J7-Johnson]